MDSNHRTRMGADLQSAIVAAWLTVRIKKTSPLCWTSRAPVQQRDSAVCGHIRNHYWFRDVWYYRYHYYNYSLRRAMESKRFELLRRFSATYTLSRSAPSPAWVTLRVNWNFENTDECQSSKYRLRLITHSVQSIYFYKHINTNGHNAYSRMLVFIHVHVRLTNHLHQLE